MRLTLRTLLAYLDDTLQANEIKTIGQKVAESDNAQDLVDRIKQVTRRRRLTIPPPTGPNARFDANDVAEYLDNELPAPEVAELEKICLESDAHLAEIAACHQILTLVLGEPALVPPTARERMYKLVQGRESTSSRRATPAADRAAPDEEPAEGAGANPWAGWLLPVAIVCLIVALGVTLWQVRTPSLSTTPGSGDLTDKPNETTPENPREKGPGNKEPGREKEPIKEKEPVKEKEPIQEKEPKVERIGAPSKELAPIAQYVGSESGQPSILVHRVADKKGWQRILKGQQVSSTESLVSLPGYRSQLEIPHTVGLLLWGHLREFSVNYVQDFLMESAVVLHKNNEVDLEVTLDRGRILLQNRKKNEPARVRLRFAEEVWDLNLLAPGTEVCIDLMKAYTPDINYRKGEEPLSELYLLVMSGEVDLRIDAFQTWRNLKAPPGPAWFRWDSFTRADGPFRLDKIPTTHLKTTPDTKYARDMLGAMKDLEMRFSQKRLNLENVLQDSFEKKLDGPLLLALYCLSAIDDVNKLIDFLGDDNDAHVSERDTAIFGLRRWISRNAQQGLQLYDEDNEKKPGLLRGKGYSNKEAAIIYSLLHDFNEQDRNSSDTYELLARYLEHDRVAIAELAWYHLRRLSVGVKELPGFNAAAPKDERMKTASVVRALVAKKKLPPPPPAPKQPEKP